MLLLEGLPVRFENPSAFWIEISPTGVIVRERVDISEVRATRRSDRLDPDPDPYPAPNRDSDPDPDPKPPLDLTEEPQAFPIAKMSDNKPSEIVALARSGIGPVQLCEDHDITAVVLRKILSGYGPYRGQGGSETVWASYFTAHEKAIKNLIKSRVTEVALS
jgi:hypothetical protein